MDDKGKGGGGPCIGDKGRRLAEEREKRLAEALRANLRRRKAQSRARDEGAASPDDGTPEGKGSDEGAEEPSS